MAEFTFKTRPKFPDAVVADGTETPVAVPEESPGDIAATLSWVESLLDHHESKEERLTLKNVLGYCDESGISDQEIEKLKAQVRALWKSKKEGKTMKAKAKTAGKPTEKAKANKAGGKPSEKVNKAAGKSNGNPDKDGKKNGNGKPKAKPAGTSIVGSSKVVKGIAVTCSTTEGGKRSVRFFGTEDDRGMPMPAVMRWMGSQKWTNEEVANVCKTLMKGAKDGDSYVDRVVSDGHVGAGRKGSGVFGPPAAVSKKEAKLLEALRK